MEATEQSVCVSDFCGTCHHKAKWDGKKCLNVAWSHPMSCSADYYPERRATVFSGMWHEVPDLIGDEPTEEQIEAHVKASGFDCEKWLDAYREQENATP